MLAAWGREWLGVDVEGGGEPEEVAAAPAGGGPSSLARVAPTVSVSRPQSLVWSKTHAPCPPAPASLKWKCCSIGYRVAGSSTRLQCYQCHSSQPGR